MDDPKENPLVDDRLAAESNQGGDDAAALPVRLNRYSRAHHRAIEMSHYASGKGDVKLSARLENCGSYLLFRDYYSVGKVRLHAAQFCKKHLLCPLCAIRRGAKMVKAYLDRLEVIKASRSDLKAYLVTLTVKNGSDLRERFQHLQRGVQKLHRMRSRERQYSEACKAEAAVWSYEFKRGQNSQEWHPHVHAVWLASEPPDALALSQQWLGITGDSFIVDVTPFHNQDDVVSGFLEVFKYALKFSELPLDDNWEASRVLAGRRLIASFGLFRGMEMSDDLVDEPLDDLPYQELLYKFMQGVGYAHVPGHQRRSDGDQAQPKRPRGRRPVLRDEDGYKSLHLRMLQRKYDG